MACDGCCLTIVNAKAGKSGAVFEVDVSNETFSRTTLGSWQVGRRINLERPLSLGDELGGHLVTGHIDGLAKITGGRKMATASGLRWKARLASPDLSRQRGYHADGVSLDY